MYNERVKGGFYMQQQILLKTEKLCKTFSNGGQQQHVLKNIDLELYQGDFTVIMAQAAQGNQRFYTPFREWIRRRLVISLLAIKSFPICRRTVLRYSAAITADLCFSKFILSTECP